MCDEHNPPVELAAQPRPPVVSLLQVETASDGTMTIGEKIQLKGDKLTIEGVQIAASSDAVQALSKALCDLTGVPV